MAPFISTLGEVSYKYSCLCSRQSQVQRCAKVPGEIQRESVQGIKKISKKVVWVLRRGWASWKTYSSVFLSRSIFGFFSTDIVRPNATLGTRCVAINQTNKIHQQKRRGSPWVLHCPHRTVLTQPGLSSRRPEGSPGSPCPGNTAPFSLFSWDANKTDFISFFISAHFCVRRPRAAYTQLSSPCLSLFKSLPAP